MDPSDETLARDNDLLFALTILGPVEEEAAPDPTEAIVVAEANLLNTLWEDVGILGALLATSQLTYTRSL